MKFFFVALRMNLGTISQMLKAGHVKSFCTKLDPVILVVLEGHNLPLTDHIFLPRLHTQRSKAHLSCSGSNQLQETKCLIASPSTI
jgi:hypothetical protein